jgi:hypothetical protein
MNEPSVALAERVRGLEDRDALEALALIAQRHGLPTDAASIRGVEDHVREALRQPDLAAETTGAPLGEGEVARAALLELARGDEGREEVERAIVLSESSEERFEPVTLAIGALVLFAFHADIELRKDPGSGWHFHFKATGLRESTMGKLLGQLAGAAFGSG